MNRWIKGLGIAGVAGALVLGASACGDTTESSRTQETTRQQDNYENLSANQPAGSMEHSPTRDTINFWVETWGSDPGKLSYVYLSLNGGGYGYFVLEGLPVSYCAMLTPNYRFEHPSPDGESNTSWENYQVVPAPGIDGAYYSGGQCDTYYGKDAESGAYVEFSVGQSQTFFLRDQPMEMLDNLVPLGDTEL